MLIFQCLGSFFTFGLYKFKDLAIFHAVLNQKQQTDESCSLVRLLPGVFTVRKTA
jgi:hypothetical protein